MLLKKKKKKTLTKPVTEENFNIMDAIMEKPKANIRLNGEKLKAFLQRLRAWQEWTFLPCQSTQ